MDNFAQDLISLLQYLLPGFIAAWVFYNFTSYPKASQFERVVQALIFTLFIQIVIQGIEFICITIGKYWYFGEWNRTSELAWSILISVILGVVFSYFSNNDKLHNLLRNIKITRETSFPSEWFGAFLKDVTFVVLHFEDERRLYGWPVEWPSEPTKGHFVIQDPSWICEKGNELRIEGVKNILIDVNDVKWVEFLEKTWEKKNG